ncbi:RNB domain-containing ribonuclease [Naumannella halotolerans]|uniref:RNB domain-containing protein n=1 Tax=Naumannella halotolerans TaxID=993414 RepID=A0A4R7J5R5_9ACTN|nr:RNB domain-containing ribonuclease [Naumannella halotolerans]TDT32690.1 RNB domain-containing protein [Naumannella halotolerans]
MPTRAFALTDDAPAELTEGLSRLQEEVGLSEDFSEAAEEEAFATCGEPRLPAADLTAIDFFAIDPPGARDIDQIMELSRDGSGYLVRYAIADLTAFLTPGGPIDQEAHQRGQTFYAPNRRFPLHPPVLSEGAASLHAGQTRPAYVWQMRLGRDGEVIDVDLGRAIVRSRAQLTYAQAQEQLDSKRADPQLELLREIGTKRLGVEIARGGVSLNLPAQEVEVVDDEWRLVFRAAREVEDWNAQISLLTGICAANIMLDAKVGIVRTLPAATAQATDRLRVIAEALGQSWPRDLGYPDFVRSIDPTTPRGVAMMYACTALFRGADYAAFDGELPEETEHAALATPYAHTTAPLRRLVDRYSLACCTAIVAGEEVPDWVRQALPDLPAEMKASSQRASRFERGILDLVEALALSPHVGQQFEGTVVEVDPDKPERGGLLLDALAVEAPVSGPGLVAGERVKATLEMADVVEGKVRFTV